MSREKAHKTISAIQPAPEKQLESALLLFAKIPSIMMLTGERSQDAIETVLAKVGEFLGVSRVTVMLDEKDGKYLRCAYEWIDRRFHAASIGWPLYDYDDIPSFKPLLDGKDALGCQIRDIPDDMRNVLARQGIVSILFAPLRKDGTWLGVLGCDVVGGERPWNELDRIVVRAVADMVVLIMERANYQAMCKKLDSIYAVLADSPRVRDYVRAAESAPAADPAKPMTLKEAEKRLIHETLEMYHGNKLRTAKHLGLTWPALDRRCKKLGIKVVRAF